MSMCPYLEEIGGSWFRTDWQCKLTGREFDGNRDADKIHVQATCETDAHYNCPYYKKMQ